MLDFPVKEEGPFQRRAGHYFNRGAGAFQKWICTFPQKRRTFYF
jgi:hypothetical protein